MNISLPFKRINLILIILCYALLSMGYETDELFDEQWTIAQTYLEKEELDKLPALIKEMSLLIKKDQPKKQAKIAYLSGEYWHYQEEWQKGIDYLNTAIKGLVQDSTAQLLLAEAYLVRGYCFHEFEDFKETLFCYQQSLTLKQKILGNEHIKISNLYFNVGYIHQEKRDLLASDKAFHKGLSILQSLYDSENEEFADFYEELGYNQALKGDLKSATTYLQKAIEIKKEVFGENSEELIFSYNYLGRLFKEDKNFSKAIIYFRQALKILNQQIEKSDFQVSMLNFIIGKSYLGLKEHTKAGIWFDKAIAADIHNEYLQPEIHRLKGDVASENGALLSAENNFKQAILGFQKDVKDNKEYLLLTYKSIIKHYLNSREFEKAIVYINKGLALGKIYYKDQPHNLFELYKNKGEYFYHRGNIEQAKLYYVKAKSTIGGDINWEDANSLQLKDHLLLNEAYANLFTEKNAELKDLSKADSILSETVNLISYLLKNYREQSTKENFIDQFYKIFKKGIEVKYALYQITKNDTYLEEAFMLSEKSKNLTLLETLKNISAFESSGIPEQVIVEENKLKTNITYLENKRFEKNQQPQINTQIIKELNSSIFDLKEKYEKLVHQIEQDYPKYYQLKFAQKDVSIKEIQQQLLADNQSIIEYFIADSSVYVFLIKKNTFQVFALAKKENLEETINQFRGSLYSYRPPLINGSNVINDSLIKTTHKLGLTLYESLFKPFKNELTKKVIIIADGALGYLPFDALVTVLPESAPDKMIPNYLMFEHLTSFAHSVNWLSGLYNDTNTEFDQNFVGIAPKFKATVGNSGLSDFRIGLGPLKYNQVEVENIKNSIGGKVIKGIAATRKIFLEHLQKGQILHLATHGKSNDEEGDYSYLAFAEPRDNTDNQFLYVKDLFNLKIPSDLVVLSACETGLGEIKRGEGIVGIGKGFSYAGAKSLVTTLWRVSDNSTANFMPIFYKNLKAGLTKDAALWKAKKEFIQTYRNAAHPFFWSGYVAYGNMEPIVFQHSNEWSIQLLLGLTFVFCLFCLIVYSRFFK